MKNTSILTMPLLIALLLFIQYGSNAQQKPMSGNMPVVKLLSALDVDEKVNGELGRATTVEIILKPHDASMPHRHPGPVYGYVLEGTFEFKVEGKPLRTLVAGETFYEPTMILHEVARNPNSSITTRVLAVVVHPRSAKQIVIPEKP